ncbi:TlpA family protein disulfide reductase [Mucilaginibacter sp. 14171R-50]|uniref:TlpA family protein disulfide reductase n=1 Tax=Mucilaginibacter sp. 14171R-50 TaxID=2703789 RepID=UPI00138D9227|nr:TlpA disulfide reductase family protein [Mucilaginibacter sp. 14171R-50]QHS56554.1 TlpA family protein disulfide reductase [Mucilaginibacter sp. 14171R-50]
MKLKISFLAALCLFFGRSGFGQEIKIGDKVPDVMIKNISGLVLDGKGVKEARLSAFAGKLLILDFWATWCAPCRRMVPVMDSLQRQFKKEVVFLPVTYESAAVVAPVLAAMRKIKPFDLPEVTGDVALHKLFPHRSLPHYVWIDPQGRVCAITEEKEVTAAHIKRMLAGAAPALATKKDLVLTYDRDQPLFAPGNNLPASAVRYQSVLSGYIPGLEAGMDIYPRDSVRGQRCNVRNVPLTWLLRMAWSDHNRWFSGAFMRLLTKDSARMQTSLSGQAYEQWLSQGNGWCYELVVPPALAGAAFDIMQQDVARLFPQYHVEVERVVTRCLVLVRTSSQDQLKTIGGKSLVDVTPFKAHLHNTRLGQLIKRLQVQYLEGYPLPVIDGTGYDGPVDLAVDAPLNDVAAMNRELARYDLQLIEKEAAVDLLVVRDADDASSSLKPKP